MEEIARLEKNIENTQKEINAIGKEANEKVDKLQKEIEIFLEECRERKAPLIQQVKTWERELRRKESAVKNTGNEGEGSHKKKLQPGTSPLSDGGPATSETGSSRGIYGQGAVGIGHVVGVGYSQGDICIKGNSNSVADPPTTMPNVDDFDEDFLN